MEKLILKQENRIGKPYKVVTAHNTAEWNIGQRLTKAEVTSLITRKIDVKIT